MFWIGFDIGLDRDYIAQVLWRNTHEWIGKWNRGYVKMQFLHTMLHLLTLQIMHMHSITQWNHEYEYSLGHILYFMKKPIQFVQWVFEEWPRRDRVAENAERKLSRLWNWQVLFLE